MAGRLRPQTAIRAATTRRDDDADSIASFQSSPSPTKASTRFQTWTGDQQVDHDTYHKMLEEHRAAKQKQAGDELKIRQLAAQLARTEEAAKRALIRADQGAKGSTAQQLLDAQRQIQQLQAENSELSSKLAKERKRATEFRSSAEDYRHRMEAALREQRQLVRKLGEAERSLGGSTAARAAARKAAVEQEYWSEEAGRRFAAQQDELVGLREVNEQLQQHLASAVPAETASRYEASIKELQQMVHFYERRLANLGAGGGSSCGFQEGVVGGGGGDAAGGGSSSSGCVGRWLLEGLVEGGACYLWEPSSGRVFSDPPEGQWPRPVGLKHADAAGGLHLGVRGRLDAAFRALADLLQSSSINNTNTYTSAASVNGHTNSSSSSSSTDGQGSGGGSSNSVSGFGRALSEGLRQLLTRGQSGRCANSCSSLAHAAADGAGVVDVRDVPALLSVLLPGLAHKEAAELAAWLRAGGGQSSSGQQQQQQGHVMGCYGASQAAAAAHVTLRELEGAVKSLVEARDAVRQGRDLTVHEALLRVRRLLRSELHAVVGVSEGLEGADGGFSSLQVVQLLQHEQLLPDLSPAEAHHLLLLLHEWDLTSTGRHSLTDVYVCLQLLTLVRLPAGALSSQVQAQQGHAAAGGGLFVCPERPDSRLSNATTSSLATTTSAAGRAVVAANSSSAHSTLESAALGGGHNSRQQKRAQGGKRSGGTAAGGTAWDGLGSAAASTLGGVGGGGGLQHGGGGGGRAAGGLTLKEAYLKERVAALEVELSHARSGAGGAGGHSKEVDQLRAEVARYQARLAELENDFLSLDVVANTEVTEYDAELRKAWFTAAAFKKRYVEHKLELDTIKETADKMQAALDDTHRALHAEAARRMALEEAVTMAKLEAARSKELAATVAAERAERLKLERDYLELQSKAFAAPGSALAEVRQLREELLAARRDRAVGEAREAELRRELSSLKRQVEGVSPEEHRRLARELAERQRQCTTMELELRAALDKLEVYRRADDAAAAASSAVAGHANTAAVAVAATSQQPDEDKSVEELRGELGQLRQAMALQGEEVQKLRQLLDTEASISLEAKAALEEAQSALTAARADATNQLAKLRRDLDHKEEKIRKLEQQLRNAYGSLGRAAVRASGGSTTTMVAAAAAAAAADKSAGSVRVSRIGLAASQAPVGQSLDESIEDLAPHENLIEILISDATLSTTDPTAAVLAADAASTFIAWDFFLHDSQATPVLPGPAPAFNTTVRYIVEADGFLLDYLSKQSLVLEVFEARGWDVRALGVAHMPLSDLLRDLEVGSALCGKRAWHHLDITGSNGQQLGRVRVGFRVGKPIDKLLLLQHQQTQEQQQREEEGEEKQAMQEEGQRQVVAAGGVDEDAAAALALQQAAEQADSDPSKASHLLITIHRCEGLVASHHPQQHPQQQQYSIPQQQQQADWAAAALTVVQRPYVHYTAPGRVAAYDTSIGASGPAPVFEDAASWGLVRSGAVMAALQQHTIQVAVFDDAVSDPCAALLGVASVPTASLAEGVPLQGAFTLSHPATGSPAGTVWVSIAWHDPLATAAVGNRLLTAGGRNVPAMLGDGGGAGGASGGGVSSAHGDCTQQQAAAGMAAGGGFSGGSTQDPAVQAMQAQLQQLQLQLQQHQQQTQQQQQQQSVWPQLMMPQQGNNLLMPCVPMLGGGGGQQQWQLDQQQQQQQLGGGTMPGVSPAAAAAVAATLASTQQQQQQMMPLLWSTVPPGDPISPFKQGHNNNNSDNSSSSPRLVYQYQTPPASSNNQAAAAVAVGVGSNGPVAGYNMRYAAVHSSQVPQQQQQQQQQQQPVMVLTPAAAGATPGPHQQALQQPLLLQAQSSPQQLQQHQHHHQQQQQPQPELLAAAAAAATSASVLRRVSTNAESWDSCDTNIYFRVEGLSLSAEGLADADVAGRHLLLAHMLLEDYTSPVQQCTETVLADGPGFLSYSYAVAYSIVDPNTKAPTAAGRALAAALAAAEAGETPALVLPVLLACSGSPVVTDFSQVDCVASCELQLSELWRQGHSSSAAATTSAGGGDIISREFTLVPAAEKAGAYTVSGCVGSLRLTLVAARALKTLRLGLQAGL